MGMQKYLQKNCDFASQREYIVLVDHFLGR